MEETYINKMKLDEVEYVQEIHLAAFPGFFLSSLGKKFLIELYTGIISDPSGIAFVAEKNHELQGFVAGTDHPKGFYKRLLRQRWYRFAFASVGPVFKNPRSIPRLFHAFSHSQAEDVHENCASLMSIAVSPKAQGNGIGKMLVRAFLIEATKRGIKRVNLTTDKIDNEYANRFYLGLGFRLKTTYSTPEGRAMNEYLIELTPADPKCLLPSE